MICWYFDSADLRIWGDASGLYSTIDAKEWSECPYLGMRSPFPRSHPSRGAWIEIKLIGFLVVALIAVGLVFNAGGVKDVLLEPFNKIIGA